MANYQPPPGQPTPDRLSTPVKVALIGGTFTIIAALISGLFVVLSHNPTPTPPTPPPNAIVTPTFAPTPSPTPAPITSFSQSAPGCSSADPRIEWVLNLATKQCVSNMTILTRTGGWMGQEALRRAGIQLHFQGQSFPSKYHIKVTVLDLSDAGGGAISGGCGAVTVHINNDGQTHDMIYVCENGIIGCRQVVGNQEVGPLQETTITPSPTGQYILDINVDGQTITYTVNNTNFGSHTSQITTTNSFSSGISLDQVWRDAQATVAFENFSFDS